ncbi:SDR family NAD(P)-dependent oxidoreductase [Pseudohalocynthiibacter aestuariivivens]|uniref:SDR family NAD(P)-dependent oxidoreductase n=1 Tax=Pseudohalocynthiibacter aestuariivivens TaxID=1591409 RepID=A0ABV5JBS6_9RHOB|nr:SDR family NAD(P)-dependent oxidoreductase [Pseudohalocynthiibacter aestuariivivens]MBS9718668.1 SDR family NAD(P)-dependent oxidoreductase [Pseudohalocynthiibacter aestuariivivens]
MTVLITGANRGIGRALFELYKTHGTEVIGTTRGAIPDESWVTLDVADPVSQQDVARRLENKPVELLVCNAGVYLDKGHSLADGYDAETWAESFAVNVTGVFLTVQAMLANLQLANTPRIAIISSQMGSDTRAPGGSYAYRASKAAALNLGRNLAADLKGLGIAVGIYHPGWVQTDMGGASAEITETESVSGLKSRFAELSLETTGSFLTWDGRTHPF